MVAAPGYGITGTSSHPVILLFFTRKKAATGTTRPPGTPPELALMVSVRLIRTAVSHSVPVMKMGVIQRNGVSVEPLRGDDRAHLPTRRLPGHRHDHRRSDLPRGAVHPDHGVGQKPTGLGRKRCARNVHDDPEPWVRVLDRPGAMVKLNSPPRDRKPQTEPSRR